MRHGGCGLVGSGGAVGHVGCVGAVRRRTALAVGLPVAAAGALAAVVAASGGGTPEAGGSPSSARRGTEVVQRRTLVESERVDGTLGYDDPRPALDRLGGTLTWLPAAGAVVRAGAPLFAVDGRPVILMDGSVPAWRALAVGRRGVDVLQLERNLSALGYDPGSVDERYSASTKAAVKRWQDALGMRQTGTVALGRVVFLPAPRRISEVSGKLGGTGSAANASWDGGQPRAVPTGYDPTAGALRTVAVSDDDGATTPTQPAATTPTGTTPTGTTPTTPADTTPTTPATTPRTTPTTPRTTPTTPTTPRTTPTTPATTTPQGGSGDGGGNGGTPGGNGGDGDGNGGNGGDGNGNGGNGGNGNGGGDAPSSEVLKTSSTNRVVTADLDAADQGLARVGGRAAIELPNGRRVSGRIVEVGTVASAASDDGGGGGGGGDGGDDDSATLPVTIRLRSERGVGHLDEAPVVVEIARTTRRDVLAVPVTALIARSGGGYAVRVLRKGAAHAVEVPVQPGLFADGYVELSDGDVRAGDRVEVPR